MEKKWSLNYGLFMSDSKIIIFLDQRWWSWGLNDEREAVGMPWSLIANKAPPNHRIGQWPSSRHESGLGAVVQISEMRFARLRGDLVIE
jgi:hypothetical protein